MRNTVLGILFVAAGALSPYAASATVVKLSGTFSQEQVNKDCAASGGLSFTGTGGTYGCVNPDNGNSVNCNGKGKCTGVINRATGSSRPTLGGVLGSRPIAAKSGNIRPGGPSTGPTRPPPPVAVSPTARGK